MNSHTLSLYNSRLGAAPDDTPAPMLGRAFALMSQAGARRTAAELRRQAAMAGDAASAESRELMSLAKAVEACKR